MFVIESSQTFLVKNAFCHLVLDVVFLEQHFIHQHLSCRDTVFDKCHDSF